VSGFWEIEASVSPAREVLRDGGAQLLVRVQILDLDNPDPSATAFIDLHPTCARRIALEILAAADDADWQTEQDGCPEPAR
jgi:4-hydroxyphenylpyruvate dioxygenase-like putative hemolysin